MAKIKKSSTVKFIFIVALVYAIALLPLVLHRIVGEENVVKKGTVFIYSGYSLDDVVLALNKEKLLKDDKSFIAYAKSAGYNQIKSGKYTVKKGMTNKALVRMLQLGEQDEVRLTIAGNIRTYDKLAGILAKNIEPDSAQIYETLVDPKLVKELGFTPDNFISMFIPNTYNVYWNITANGLMKRMKREYDKFWNTSRTNKLDSLKITREDVIIIASIVNEETIKKDEMPRVAGVYINRLNKRMKLDADPTVKYAVGDFSLKRVLFKHLEHDSPYNTYLYAGLPPGPICIPSIAAIDAVLNYESHDYFYFCAKDDFSGYHVFAKTLQQHNVNANAYRAALNKNRIY